MSLHTARGADQVFSVEEVAVAAGVPIAAAAELIEAGDVRTADGFLLPADAIVCVRALRRFAATRRHELFGVPRRARRSAAAGLAGTGALHLAFVGFLAAIAAWGLDTRGSQPTTRLEPARLVFLATPGPGGGGGGGGLKQPDPPTTARMKTPAALVKSPVPRPKPTTTQRPRPLEPPPRPPVVTEAKPVDPPPPPARPDVKPQVIAPVVSAAPDARDRAGVLAEGSESESQGSGSGGGAGTGQGTGIGEGSGAGVGPGSGGGTGGGPYRPGSGISPPSLLHEVRPDYTDVARRQGVEGEVVLEIVVRQDGSVGNLKVLAGLGAGLDQRAIDAVRQWRFSPARRQGTPVDVVVEVAVEFRLR